MTRIPVNTAIPEELKELFAATPHIQIILAATRTQRRGAPIARWFTELAAARDDLSFELVDLAELAPALLANASPPMRIQSRDGAAHEWSQKLAAADGYPVATPEYKHGYPAPLKNALDHLFSEWNRKPIGFISYGASGGGLRAVDQLRQVAIELDMVPIRRQANARARAAISEDGELREPPVAEAQVLLNDIVRWATTLRAGRAVAQPA